VVPGRRPNQHNGLVNSGSEHIPSPEQDVALSFGLLRLHPSRLIYGTIILVALLGILAENTTITTVDALAVIVGSSFALWVAHCFSEGVGAHLRLGRTPRSSEVRQIAIEELSVVAFAAIPVASLMCAGFGLLDVHTALRVAAWGGVGVLAVSGWALGKAGHLSTAGRLLAAVLCAALGTTVVLIEVAFSH
jgi:hypothetical protein